MSDLKLVPPDQPTPFEQRLLDAVVNESPSAEQRARVRLALGLPVSPPPTASLAVTGRRALLLKTGGLILTSVALVWFFAAGHKSRSVESRFAAPSAARIESRQAAATPSSVASQTAEAAVPVDPAAPASAAVPSPEVLSRAAASERNARGEGTPSKRSSKPSVADDGADLSEQLRLIDTARAAVAAGNASVASSTLASYRSRFPRGPFGQEAAVLQIETLELQGNHALAATQARNFLTRYPNSPHLTVVRRIAER